MWTIPPVSILERKKGGEDLLEDQILKSIDEAGSSPSAARREGGDALGMGCRKLRKGESRVGCTS